MKLLVWDKTLSVQVDEIDDDHRKLVELFNLLTRSIADREPYNYIEAVLEELLNYTVWHFKHEERLMLKYAYKGLHEHKIEHQELIKSAISLQQKFVHSDQSLSSEDIEFLELWLTGHILGADMELGTFLSNVM